MPVPHGRPVDRQFRTSRQVTQSARPSFQLLCRTPGLVTTHRDSGIDVLRGRCPRRSVAVDTRLIGRRQIIDQDTQ